MNFRTCFKEQIYQYGLVVFGGTIGATIGLYMDPQTKLLINNINDFALFSFVFVVVRSCMRFVYKNYFMCNMKTYQPILRSCIFMLKAFCKAKHPSLQ